MANQKSIKVGIFAPTRPDAVVPSKVAGHTIYYSPKFNFFACTDADGNTSGEFGAEQFQRFTDAGVISFTTPGMEHHINELLFGKTEQEPVSPASAKMQQPHTQDPYSDQQPSPSYNMYDKPQSEEETAAVRRINRATQEALGDNAAQYQKDPTRHIPVFMALTLIFAIIICVVLNFGQPIISAIAPLLSR